jgi:hypothetical protein
LSVLDAAVSSSCASTCFASVYFIFRQISCRTLANQLPQTTLAKIVGHMSDLAESECYYSSSTLFQDTDSPSVPLVCKTRATGKSAGPWLTVSKAEEGAPSDKVASAERLSVGGQLLANWQKVGIAHAGSPQTMTKKKNQ